MVTNKYEYSTNEVLATNHFNDTKTVTIITGIMNVAKNIKC